MEVPMPFHKPERGLAGLTQKKMSTSGEMNPILGVQMQEMPMFHMHSNSLAVLSSLGFIISMNEPYSVLSLPQLSFSII